MKKLILLIVVFTLKINAAIIYTNLSRDAIQGAVDAAASDDIIAVFPGETTFNQRVQILGKPIRIIGLGGTNGCIIHDNVVGTGNNGACFYMTPDLGEFVRISGFQFVNGTRTNSQTGGTIYVAGQSKSIRIDNIFFDNDYNTSVTVQGGACGVWDTFTCDMATHTHSIFVKHPSFDGTGVQGNKAWATQLSQHTPGGTSNTNKWWIQDGRTINTGNPGSFIDSEQGARWGMSGIQFNGTNNNIVTHGDETQGAETRGTQEFEIVGCTMANADPNSDGCINLRSGAGCIVSNVFNGGKNFIKLSNYRSTEPYTWGGINGKKVTPNFTNLWDQFDLSTGSTPFETGTHNGGNNTQYFEDSTKSWTTNQWIGYSIHNLNAVVYTNTPPARPFNNSTSDWQTGYRYSMVYSNTATRIYYLGASYYFESQGQTMMRFTNTWPMELWKPTNALGACGLSKCDLRANLDPPVWLNFENYGVNMWSNTWNGTLVTNNYGFAKDPLYQENYHYFFAPKAGWSFLGKHPLRVDTFDLTPTSGAVVFGATIDFNASGGGAGSSFYYEVVNNASGASINSSSGVYTAGNVAGTDTVRVWDLMWANYRDAEVVVSSSSGTPTVKKNIIAPLLGNP